MTEPPDDDSPHPADVLGNAAVERARPHARARPRTAWSGLLLRSERGKVASSPANAATTLTHDPAWEGVLEYEERTGRVVFSKAPPCPEDLGGEDRYPREVIDADLVRIGAWVERAHGVSYGGDALSSAIDTVARCRSRDPVREYLDALVWDQHPRIDTWTHDYLGVRDDLYSRGVGSAWLISAVARTMTPGCQADHMIVLEGGQGIGKSTAMRTLAGSAWYTDSLPDLRHKDAADALRGPWIVEMSELDALGRVELAAAKAFISRQSDRYRESYGRRTHDHARRCVFVGSTNEDTYLRDSTGARRFWPLTCTAIDRDGIAASRDQLWAEAVARWRTGAPWHPDAALSALARAEQDERYQPDAWEGEIDRWLDSDAGLETTVREIAIGALKMDLARLDQWAQQRIARALKRLGWVSDGNPKTRAVDGKKCRVRVYRPSADRPEVG